jgi:lipopolysaccharide export system protein LptA
MRKWVHATLACLLILVSLSGYVLAAGNETAAAAKPKKKLRVRVLDNKFFKMEKDTVVIKGLIEVTHGDSKIVASEITYDSKKQFAVLTGGVRLEQDDIVLTGDKFSAWFSDDKFQVDGNVSLTKKDKPKDPKDKSSAAKAVPDKIVLSSSTMEYNTEKKSLVAKGDEVVVQEKERRAVAKEVQYDDKTERLVLIGDAVVTEQDDKILKGSRVSIDINKDTVEVEGPSEVEFVLKEEEKTVPKPDPAAGATAAPGASTMTSTSATPEAPSTPPPTSPATSSATVPPASGTAPAGQSEAKK